MTAATVNYPVGHPKHGGRCGASIPGRMPRSAYDRAIPAGVCALLAGHPGRHNRKDDSTMKLATATDTGTPTTTVAAPAAMTVADMLAMVELGTLDPATAVVPEAAIEARIAQAAAIARKAGEDAGASRAAKAAAETFGTGTAAALPPGMVPVPAGTHDCGMAGCNHGASHDGPSQPDRQLKMTCPCGTVVRLTHRALQRAGSLTCGSGHTLTVDHTRRAYGAAR